MKRLVVLFNRLICPRFFVQCFSSISKLEMYDKFRNTADDGTKTKTKSNEVQFVFSVGEILLFMTFWKKFFWYVLLLLRWLAWLM